MLDTTAAQIQVKVVVRRWWRGVTDLLSVVGCVREHGGDVKHQLVVLVGGVERVHASGVRWKTKEKR